MTSVHSATDVRIRQKECATLAAAGWEVVLVACAERSESGSDGVHLIAVPLGRGRLARTTIAAWRVYRAAKKEEADLYQLHDPELLPWAFLLKIRGKRVVYDVHEDLPIDILGKTWIPRPLRRIVSAGAAGVEWLAGRALDQVVAATPFIAQRFAQQGVTLVQNFPQAAEFPEISGCSYAARPAAFAYIGGIERERGIAEMIDAIGLLAAEERAELRLAGRFGSDSLRIAASIRPGWKHVRWEGWVDRVGIAELLGGVRAGLVVLHPLRNFLESQPTKLFEYMSAGLPVIASDFPFWRRIVSEADCGLLVDPLDPGSIAGAMHWILDHPEEAEAMGKRGRDAVRSKYSWAPEGDRLVALYERLTDGAKLCAE
jgi:glycosyltransferase involved in cell wall biosynthesis